jgi:uncharacterized protein YndB with AHSA1/START domain
MTTSNPPAVADQAELTVRRTIRIDAPVDKVWAAVTEPEHISRWFGEAALDGSGAGARGSLTWPDRGAVPLRIDAIDPPRMVAYRWTNDGPSGALPAEVQDDRSTQFTFTLEQVPGGTRLTVVETGFETTSDPEGNLRSHREGWDSELDELVAYLERTA